MKIFETLQTAFKVLFASLTEDGLFFISLGLLGVLILWAVLALMFNFQTAFRKNCIKVIEFLRENDLSAENYQKFTSLWKDFPPSMRRAWKRYETKRSGLPSDYLSQAECFDTHFSGGIFKQSRSLMRTSINFSAIFIALLSLAIIGTTTDGVVTAMNLVDALIVPILFYLCSIVVYYVYTAIRHFDYRATVDTFHDFVDMLDERVSLDDALGSEMDSLGIVSEIYENDTLLTLKEKAEKARNASALEDFTLGSKGLNPAQMGILGKQTPNKKAGNIISGSTSAKVLNTSASRNLDLEIEDRKVVILNEQQFANTVSKVEMLLEKAKQEKNEQLRTELEKEINRNIKALTEFKQKARAVKGDK